MSDIKVRNKTIEDFNNQWKLQGDLNDDYWASDQILFDQISEIFSIEEVKDKIVGDVGAGTGRVVKTFLKYNPKKIYAIEPSPTGINHINRNLSNNKNLVVINSDGLSFKTPELCDFIYSLGVIHHIKNPTDILKNIKKNLKSKGKILLWVYGYENNIPYVFVYKVLSKITKKLPDRFLYFFSTFLNAILQPYILLCKLFNLPLKKYFLEVFNKCGWKKRNDIIFDQLNPAYAKYYKKEEIKKELLDAGFINLKFYHRHGYSWTVLGEKE